jgi:hypothetical protein
MTNLTLGTKTNLWNDKKLELQLHQLGAFLKYSTNTSDWRSTMMTWIVRYWSGGWPKHLEERWTERFMLVIIRHDVWRQRGRFRTRSSCRRRRFLTKLPRDIIRMRKPATSPVRAMTVHKPQTFDSFRWFVHLGNIMCITTTITHIAFPLFIKRTKGSFRKLWLIAEFINTMRIKTSICSIVTTTIHKQCTNLGFHQMPTNVDIWRAHFSFQLW